tara:strand:+ start:219 stop:1367 length:1149 start_codon:yes stop_codon:yes gene_type:complete
MMTEEEKRRQRLAEMIQIQGRAGANTQSMQGQEPPGARANALRQDIVANTQQANLATPMSPEELAMQSEADALAARAQATTAYNEKDKWKGSGLLGTPVAAIINKFHDKDGKIAAREDSILRGLSKSREQSTAVEKRKGLDRAKLAAFNAGNKFDETTRSQEFDTGERLAEQGFDTEASTIQAGRIQEAETLKYQRGMQASRADGIYKSNEAVQEQYYNDAQTSMNMIDQIDNFLAASPGTVEGGAQPLMSAAENFLSSFGFDSGDLEKVALMDKAVGSIKADYLAKLGARGLTDKDMEVLASNLPKVATSQEARESVANVLRKESLNNVYKYLDVAEKEEASNPGQRMRPEWFDAARGGRKYQAYKILQRRKRDQQASRWD